MRSLILCAALLFLAALAHAQDTLLDQGYRQMYNLEFDQAHKTFQAWERAQPADPMGPVSDAAAYLFAEFDRLHILQAEFFTTDENFTAASRLTPDPAVKRKFEESLAQAQKLSERILATAPGDPNATFAEILRLGLHADYLALIEKRNLQSLTELKTGRVLAQKLLAAHPHMYDAYLAVGVENYMLSLKPAPVRWILRLSGAETDKDEGVRQLSLTASSGRFLRPYARLLIAVAALRDHDPSRAREILAGLSREFPKNPLYAQEMARIR